ncbi:hypothetical protein CCMA1212_004195 [Trichoderma ghanense]|uniref:Uncharacterized protein n=1 Tax=Trichoderma ghanense TaxID=65468 RepID=A0ABY2H4X6_9HYPO
MESLFSKTREAVNQLEGDGISDLKSPAVCVLAYTAENSKYKPLVDKVIQTIDKPLFLPITASIVGLGAEEGDYIEPIATILVHAVQILLFAPTSWQPDLKYSTGEYEHRYPTPPGHGGDCRSVAGQYSLEDLHRAVLLLLLSIYRRQNTTLNRLATQRAPQARGLFPGYYDVVTQKPQAAVTPTGPVEEAAIRILRNPLKPATRSNTTASVSSLTTPTKSRSKGTSLPTTPRKSAQPSVDDWLEFQNLFVECDAVTDEIQREFEWDDHEENL